MMLKHTSIPLFVCFLLFWSCSAPPDSEGDDAGWFAFDPGEDFAAPAETDLSAWLDAPAGKHGFLQMGAENLAFEDGTEVRFWGTNICSQRPFVEAAEADRFVQMLRRFGMNAVRFHKFSWYAYVGDRSTRFDPEKFARLDYFQAKLRESGVYYGWSHIYGHRVQPGDSSQMLAYEEVKNLSYPWSHLNGSTSSLVNFAPDLQDLNIALTVDMLNHVNPHTGLRYADDPALAFIEFQNEDDIFWSAIERSLEQAPTYRALLCRLFSEWLLDKYGAQAALEKAWGAENLPEGETLARKNIYPQPSQGLFSAAYERFVRDDQPMPQHLLDKMHFLYETQLAFYKKFEKAVRDTGYKGVLVASCWQAGSGFSHFYNLHTDYEIGMIDRHNYFGGGAGGHRLDTGAVKNKSMLSRPGSGLLSTGMQQVADRPFSFSEWMSLIPNEWTAEADVLIAAYGMGLQGWDASFSFAVDHPRYSPYLQSESHGVYNVTSPLHMGLYPALAPMIYRGDVMESPVLATRNVHIPSLAEGKLGFVELVKQDYDVKSFTGTVPSEALAIGRFPVQFTNTYQLTTVPDLSPYWDSAAAVIRSATGQLAWHYGERDFVTINTAGTKGLAGFTAGQTIELDDWSISTTNPFAIVLVTSLEPDKGLAEANRILITTAARARNTGMVYNETGDTLLAKGDAPLLLEAVDATIHMPERGPFKVEVLDHNGRSTGQMIETKSDVLHLDGQRRRTMYYLIRY